MEKMLVALLFLSANIKMAFAATGERSDDYLVLLVPFVVLTIVWAGYQAKAKFKERNNPEAEAPVDPDTSQNSVFEEV